MGRLLVGEEDNFIVEEITNDGIICGKGCGWGGFFVIVAEFALFIVFLEDCSLHCIFVNPQMVTNTVWKQGVPKCDFFCLPPPFHTGITIWKWGNQMGIYSPMVIFS